RAYMAVTDADGKFELTGNSLTVFANLYVAASDGGVMSYKPFATPVNPLTPEDTALSGDHETSFTLSRAARVTFTLREDHQVKENPLAINRGIHLGAGLFRQDFPDDAIKTANNADAWKKRMEATIPWVPTTEMQAGQK